MKYFKKAGAQQTSAIANLSSPIKEFSCKKGVFVPISSLGSYFCVFSFPVARGCVWQKD
jgi:hypothetical protein